MRIAVNTRLLVPEKMDGIGRFTYESLKRITENHSNISFDFIFDRTPPKSFNFTKNVTFYTIGLPARHPVLWYLWFEHYLKNFVNRHQYDLFLSPEGWVPPSLNCPSLAVIHDLNFVHQPEHIIFSHRKFLEHFFPKYAKRANRIATVSEFSKKDIQTVYHINPTNIDVVYNGANSVFSPVSSEEKEKVKEENSDGKPYFIFIGTLHPRKNLEHLFKAFEIFKKTDNRKMQLLVVGNKKWWPQELDKLFQSMQYKNCVLFVGRKSDEELSKLLASAEALTYLPYFEGFGIPILEAFQAETPVITSNCSSMPEVAENAAILCNPRNVSEISLAMKKISQSSSLRKDLISKGVNRADFFSWNKTADLLWKSIEKCIQDAS